MDYTLHMGLWNSVFAVPTALVDRYLQLAGKEQLQVLLWMLRHGGQPVSPETLAQQLNMNVDSALDALEYWVQEGQVSDIRKAKKAAALFKEEGTNIPRPVYFTHLIINPDQQDDLIPATMDQLPPGVVLDPNTGDVKGVAGLSVINTAWLTAGVALLVRAKDKLLYCVREELRLDRTENFATAAEEVRTLEAYTFAILYGDNVYKITGC